MRAFEALHYVMSPVCAFARCGLNSLQVQALAQRHAAATINEGKYDLSYESMLLCNTCLKESIWCNAGSAGNCGC